MFGNRCDGSLTWRLPSTTYVIRTRAIKVLSFGVWLITKWTHDIRIVWKTLSRGWFLFQLKYFTRKNFPLLECCLFLHRFGRVIRMRNNSTRARKMFVFVGCAAVRNEQVALLLDVRYTWRVLLRMRSPCTLIHGESVVVVICTVRLYTCTCIDTRDLMSMGRACLAKSKNNRLIRDGSIVKPMP